jgi:ketosteroid isomerase-like protein
MSEQAQENIDIVKRVLAAFKRGDTQTFLSLLSDDVDFRHPMSTEIWPWAGKRRGRAEVGESWARLAEVGV